MKTLIKRAMVLGAVVAALGTGVAHATMLEVVVPFAFDAQGQRMAAGRYLVESTPGSSVVYLRNTRDGSGVFVSVMPTNTAETMTLTFSNSADGYELATVGGATVASPGE